MLLETIRCVTTALNTGSIGVNTQIAGLPVDNGDVVPPNIVYITDETVNLSLALNKAPADVGYPMLLVTILSPVDMAGEVVSTVRSSEIQVLIQYIASGIDTHNMVRDAYYTMRAVVRCLHDFHSNDHADMRNRNGISIQECLSLTHQTVETFEQDNKVVTGIIAQYLVRDSQV